VRASDRSLHLAPPNPESAVAGRGLAPSKVADQLAFLEEAGRASRCEAVMYLPGSAADLLAGLGEQA
jgi:hypothetical protein